MDDKVTLSTFPSGRVEALTMLYLQKPGNITNHTPEELADLYLTVHDRIAKQLSSHQSAKTFQKP